MIKWWSKGKVATGNKDFDRYLQQVFKIPKDLPIEDLHFVVLDCEMTGLDKQAELVSLGAVKVANNRIEVADALDLKFSFASNNAASEIHGELGTTDGKSPQACIAEILNFLQNAIVVGHSVSIDLDHLNRLLASTHSQLKLCNPVLDTYDLMVRLDPTRFERTIGGQNALRLDALCEELDVPIENRHTALGDAYMTAQLFLKLLSRLRRRKVLKAGQLMR